MNKLSIVLIFVAAVVFAASTVCAGSYVSGNVGVGFTDDVTLSSGGVKAELSSDPGFAASIALGHEYDNGFRAEVEAIYSKSDFDDVTVTGSGDGDGTSPVNGDATTISVMLNAFANFVPDNRYSPFVGAGIGYAYADVDIEGVSEDDNLFAYQAIAGVSVALTERLKSDIQYRYFGTSRFEPGSGVSGDTIKTHILAIGLRYSF